MAGKHLIDGKLCVVRVNVQSSLERFEQGEDGGGGKLKARMLTTENNGRLASLGQGVWPLLLLGASTGLQRLWSSSTCVGVRLLFCGTCGLTTSLPPLIKSQPVGCVHKGGASSTPMSDTASGCKPLLSHCWSSCPRPTLLPWKASRIGGRLYPRFNSLLWNNLSSGRQRIQLLTLEQFVFWKAEDREVGWED